MGTLALQLKPAAGQTGALPQKGRRKGAVSGGAGRFVQPRLSNSRKAASSSATHSTMLPVGQLAAR